MMSVKIVCLGLTGYGDRIYDDCNANLNVPMMSVKIVCLGLTGYDALPNLRWLQCLNVYIVMLRFDWVLGMVHWLQCLPKCANDEC